MDHDTVPQVLVRVGVVPVTEKAPPPTPRRPLSEVFRIERLMGTAMRDSNASHPSLVVGIDGSQAAIRAAEWAVDEALSQRCHCA